jgi:predicted acylesterase/phospholipase RssA
MHNRSPRQLISGLVVIVITASALALILAGCSDTTRIAYASVDAENADVNGFADIRATLDARLDGGKGDPAQWRPSDTKKDLNLLMISGGGAGGAFTVGILCAWTKSGKRPRFDVVTGVSTGALIAPYAFLGQAYDDRLAKLYTSGIASSLVQAKWMGTGLLGSSLLKAEPLRHMVEQYMTAGVLAQIAAEHHKGRRLLVLTTNLDSQKAVVWNMGAIAASGRPDALRLFQDVLIASASIPGIYPAVMIKVQSGSHRFEEMHSDGGSASQVLTLPEQLLTDGARLDPRHHQNINLYVIVNNALMPEFSTTANRTLPVMARAYSMLVKSQTRASLIALYGYAMRTKAHFHVASIDRHIPFSVADPFNTGYMRAVYALGYADMSGRRLWHDRPIFQ